MKRSASIIPIHEITHANGLLRIQPLHDWIALAVSHQSHTHNWGMDGIIQPETWSISHCKFLCELCGNQFTQRTASERAACPNCMQDTAIAIDRTEVPEHADESMSGDHYATILGVGPLVSGLAFGHRVQVTRWADGEWFYDWPRDYPRVAVDPMHPGRRIAIPEKARLAYVKPEDIVFIVTDFAGLAGWPHGLAPGTYPAPGRIFLMHDPLPPSPLGLLDIQRGAYPTPWATVLDTAHDVAAAGDIEISDRVLTSDEPKCSFWQQDGLIYSMMRACDVLAVDKLPVALHEVGT